MGVSRTAVPSGRCRNMISQTFADRVDFMIHNADVT
jgi:hypothetical protein